MFDRFVLALCAVLTGSVVCADDWPQFRGPDRNGISKEKGLLKAWPKGGPPLVWTFKDAGLGFSSVAVAKGVVYTLGADMKFQDEYAIALDEKTGSELWRAKIGPLYTVLEKNKEGVLVNVNAYGDGPRATPTIDGNLLFALGGKGQLVCLDVTQKGKEVWRKHLIDDLGGVIMDKYGFSEAPLVDGDRVICTPGGPKGMLAALDKKTGTVVWRSTDWTDKAPFSSIIPAEIHGVRQYIQTGYDAAGNGRGVIAGVDAKNGKLLWSTTNFTGSNQGIGTSAVVAGNLVYITAGDGAGCGLFEIDAKQKAMKNKYSKTVSKKVRNAHGGVVLVDGYIYGHSEREMWICQNYQTGKIEWDEKESLPGASGSLVAADGKLYLYSDNGEVGLADADPTKFNLVSSFTIPIRSTIPMTRTSSRSARTWAHPVIANGILYVRDTEYIFAFKIAAK
jgi:outer membrane protein assembly factor BamB